MPASFLNTAEAAKLLGLKNTASLIQMRFRGEGPPWIRVGVRLVRYKLEDLIAWTESRRVVPGAAPKPKAEVTP